MATLADHVSTYLIAQGVVRDPRVAGSLPPRWLQPANGVPAPGEGSNPTEVGPTVVVGISRTDGLASRRFERAWRFDVVDFVLRTKKYPDAERLYAQMRPLLIDKSNWIMGSITVIESREWRGLAEIDSDEQQGYTSVFAVLFESYAADHF